MKALQSCLSRFMNACTDMLEKYNDVQQDEVCRTFFQFCDSIDAWVCCIYACVCWKRSDMRYLFVCVACSLSNCTVCKMQNVQHIL